jgi:hypothetical protein
LATSIAASLSRAAAHKVHEAKTAAIPATSARSAVTSRGWRRDISSKAFLHPRPENYSDDRFQDFVSREQPAPYPRAGPSRIVTPRAPRRCGDHAEQSRLLRPWRRSQAPWATRQRFGTGRTPDVVFRRPR